MLVYVLNKNGLPLMPTSRLAKVRKLIASKKAVVVKRSPFVIKLNYKVKRVVQRVSLGVDAGSKHIGVSATTATKELYSAQFETRNDVVDLLSTRRECRRARRNYHTRYRACRFLNRVKSKNKGWLATSVECKVEEHIRVIENVKKILPITKITIEVASFDAQKIKDDVIKGVKYQCGNMLGFWNVREYVLFRDNHECQLCHGKSKDKVLNVHHIESRKTGGNSPDNLITLCETCHHEAHTKHLEHKIKRSSKSLRDAAFMGIMRWEVYNRLKAKYGNKVHLTYGYKTKNMRIKEELEKSHRIDAMCISGNIVTPSDDFYFGVFKRRHNRQIHKSNMLKGGVRKLNQSPYLVFDYRLFDKVKYNDREGFVFGRRSKGSFLVKTLKGDVLGTDINYKKLTFVDERSKILIERRQSEFLPQLKWWVPFANFYGT